MPLCVPTTASQSAWGFPIGSIYISVLPTNPAILLGYGTWVAFGVGRVLVGVDISNPSFDIPEKTSGALTMAAAGTCSASADHASHTHTYTAVPNHVHPLATGTTATGNFSQVIGTVDTSSGGTGATPTQTALGTLSGNPVGGVASGTTAGPSAALTHTAPVFTGSPTSVVQPSVAVYMWKRIA